MRISIIAFTRNGGKLAQYVHDELSKLSILCNGYVPEKYLDGLNLSPLTVSLSDWTSEQFDTVDAILYIGATGIAVRAIAPFIKDKTKDPAVIVMDEQGNYCISLLSGHIGGANELTSLISSLCHAVPIITTATDINERFSVDLFAKNNELGITDMRLAKEISGYLLDGKSVGFLSDFDTNGEIPDGVFLCRERKENTDIRLSSHDNDPIADIGFFITLYPNSTRKPFARTLYLIPKIVSIGVGCKKDTPFDILHGFIHSMLKEQGLLIESIRNIASISLKENEPAILEFARIYELPFITYTAEELDELEGDFHESEFVKSITGVGNVCERAATLASNHGQIILTKQAKDGVTIALSLSHRRITF